MGEGAAWLAEAGKCCESEHIAKREFNFGLFPKGSGQMKKERNANRTSQITSNSKNPDGDSASQLQIAFPLLSANEFFPTQPLL